MKALGDVTYLTLRPTAFPAATAEGSSHKAEVDNLTIPLAKSADSFFFPLSADRTVAEMLYRCVCGY